MLVSRVVGEHKTGRDHQGVLAAGSDVDLGEDGAEVEVDEGPGLGGRQGDHLRGREGVVASVGRLAPLGVTAE